MPARSFRQRLLHEPAFAAFMLLRVTFSVAPLAFGIDKFFNAMVDWPNYLAPWVNDIVPGTGQEFMYFVGGVEIVAGLVVAIKPRYGSRLVCLWLLGIVVNLFSYSGFYDVAVRDFGLLLSALSLALLAPMYDPRGLRIRLHR
jgi:hypothetical protein